MILSKEETRRKLRAGANKLADVVKSTLGPSGGVVVLKGGGVTKDGVTVAKDVTLEDETENYGAAILRQASQETADVAGDGTTTSCVLAQALVNGAIRFIEGGGADPQALRRELEVARDQTLEYLPKLAKKVKDQETLERIAIVSANQDVEMGKKVAEVVWNTGKAGAVIVEEGQRFGIETELVDGCQIRTGFVGPYMSTNAHFPEAIYEANPGEGTKVAVLCIDFPLEKFESLLPALRDIAVNPKIQLVIFARRFSHEVLSGLMMNRQKAKMGLLAIALNGAEATDTLEDIAEFTGATLISDPKGFNLEHVAMDKAGWVQKIISTDKTTLLQQGAGKPGAYLDRMKGQLSTETGKHKKQLLEERIARLEGKIGVIRISAPVRTDLDEKKARLDDAIRATRSALEEGVVVGGGSSYINLLEIVSHETFGGRLLREALEAPLRTIAENTGDKPDVIVEAVKNHRSSSAGYDAVRREVKADLIETGVIDPAKVVRCAIENAVSAACSIFTACGASIENPKPPVCNSSPHTQS